MGQNCQKKPEANKQATSNKQANKKQTNKMKSKEKIMYQFKNRKPRAWKSKLFHRAYS